MTVYHGYLSPSQAGRELKVSVERVRQLMEQGALEFERTPLGRLVLAASVERLRKQRESEGRHHAAR